MFDSVSPYEIAEAVKARYAFKQGPAVEELSKPEMDEVQFYFGEMERGKKTVRIEQFSIRRAPDDLSIWIGAATKTSTDDTDAFLEDVLGWANTNYGIDTGEILPVRYHNQLEVLASSSIGDWFERVQPIAGTIAAMVESYGFEKLDFQLSGIKCRVDETHPTGAYLNSEFLFERRANRAYSDHCYFTQAPLRTRDHQKLVALIAGIFES